MDKDLPLTPLLTTAQTAAIIRAYRTGAPLENPPQWTNLDRREQFNHLHRSATRAAVQAWYEWLQTQNPTIDGSDVAMARSITNASNALWPTLAGVMRVLSARGYEPMVTQLRNFRYYLIASALVFARSCDPRSQDDAGICATYMFTSEKDSAQAAKLMNEGAKPADAFIFTLSRSFALIEQKTGRHPNHAEFELVTGRIINFMMQSAYRHKFHSLRELFFQEIGENQIDMQWDNGRLMSVTYKQPDDSGWDETDHIDGHMENAHLNSMRTGCPAVFARVAGMRPNNPVKFMLHGYANAARKGLFCPADGNQALRAAQKITL